MTTRRPLFFRRLCRLLWKRRRSRTPSAPDPWWRISSASLLVSIGLHLLLLLAVGGFIVSHTRSGPRFFENNDPPSPLTLVDDAPQAPPLLDASPSPSTGTGQDDDPGALPDSMDGVQQFQQGLALDVVASTGNSPFQLPVRNPVVGGRIAGGGTGRGGAGQGSGSGRRGSGSVMGLNITAQRLGVLLDVSGSMYGILPEVIRQIDQQFKDYVLVLVPGCSVEATADPGEFSRMDFEEGVGLFYMPPAFTAQLQKLPHRPFLGPRADSGQAIEYIIGRLNVDSIYWFSDFQDRVAPERMTKLGDLLKEKHIRLYVNSVESTPHPTILQAVGQTGGDSQVNKLK